MCTILTYKRLKTDIKLAYYKLAVDIDRQYLMFRTFYKPFLNFEHRNGSTQIFFFTWINVNVVHQLLCIPFLTYKRAKTPQASLLKLAIDIAGLVNYKW